MIKKLSKETVIEQFVEIHGNEYDYSKTNYKKAFSYVEIYCKTCNRFFHQIASKHINDKSGCPYCKMSKGERKIINFLDKMNILFEHEYRFDDCKNKLSLPFDFYLPKHNICIEYQGIQHYAPTGFGSTNVLKKFKKQQQNDYIKRNYCEKNNIRLLTIPYWEFKKINEVLYKIINI